MIFKNKGSYDWSFTESLPDGVIIVQNNWDIIYANEYCNSIFGYAPGELEGKSLEALTPERLLPIFVWLKDNYNKAPQIIRMGSLPVDLKAKRKDGSEFHMDASIGPLKLEGEDFTIAFIRDISKAKRLNKFLFSLAEGSSHITEQDLFDQLLQNLSVYFGTSYLMLAEFLNDNQQSAQSLSLFKNREKIDGLSFPIANTPFEKITSKEAFVIENNALNIFQENHKIKNWDFNSLMAVPLISKNGTIIGMLAAFFESNLPDKEILNTLLTITADRCAFELERSNYIHQLEKTSKELINRNKELDHFTYVTAHDLKSPISNISSLVDLIYSTHGVKEENKEYFDLLKKSVEQLNNTITNLNVAIANKHQFEDIYETVSLKEKLKKVNLSLHENIQKSRAVIKADFSKCPTIQFSQTGIFSIFLNLLSNSLKYVQKGKTPEIFIKSEELNGHFILTFKDNGQGFNYERNKDKIFGLFKRFHPGGISGTGLGLYIVNSIVQKNGGIIEVSSIENEGTEFRVFLKKA